MLPLPLVGLPFAQNSTKLWVIVCMVLGLKCTTSLCRLTFISHRRSNVVGSKCLSLRSAHLFAEDSFCQENRNWRNSHFMVYEIDFSFSVLTFFVNCAFLAVTY